MIININENAVRMWLRTVRAMLQQVAGYLFEIFYGMSWYGVSQYDISKKWFLWHPQGDVADATSPVGRGPTMLVGRHGRQGTGKTLVLLWFLDLRSKI